MPLATPGRELVQVLAGYVPLLRLTPLLPLPPLPCHGRLAAWSTPSREPHTVIQVWYNSDRFIDASSYGGNHGICAVHKARYLVGSEHNSSDGAQCVGCHGPIAQKVWENLQRRWWVLGARSTRALHTTHLQRREALHSLQHAWTQSLSRLNTREYNAWISRAFRLSINANTHSRTFLAIPVPTSSSAMA